MMPAGCAPRVLLDIGTGTGIVPEVLAEIFRTLDVLQAAIYHSLCFNKQRRGSQTSLVVIGQKSRQPL